MAVAVVPAAVLVAVLVDAAGDGGGVGAAEDRVGVEVAGGEFPVFVAAAGFDYYGAVEEALILGVFGRGGGWGC